MFVCFKYPCEDCKKKQKEYAEGDLRVNVNAADLFEIVNEFHIYLILMVILMLFVYWSAPALCLYLCVADKRSVR